MAITVFVSRKIRKAIDNHEACLACKRNAVYTVCVYIDEAHHLFKQGK